MFISVWTACNLSSQILECSATKALTGLHLAQQYMRYGFTTLRDMGTLDPDWPTINLRDAIEAGLVQGPRLIVAAHMISATGGHADHAERISMPLQSWAFEGRGFTRQDP